MPHPLWRHGPCCSRPAYWSSQPSCAHCQQPGAFDGWHLSMHQDMARYQYVFGLKPLGPHRALADALFKPLRAECSRCAGRGILTRAEGEWHACPTCEGTGGSWTVAEPEVQAAWRKVVDAFPGAATAEVPADFLSGAVVLDIAGRCMVGSRSSRQAAAAPPPVATGQREQVSPKVPRTVPSRSIPSTTPNSVLGTRDSELGTQTNWHPWRWLVAFIVVRALVAMMGR